MQLSRYLDETRSHSGLLLTSLVLASTIAAAQEPSPSPTAPGDDGLRRMGIEIRAKADAGDVAAQRFLGTLYMAAGRHTEAAPWLRRAADQGDTYSQGTLGWMHRSGEGVPQDFTLAFELSLAAAEKDDPQGALTLAVLHSLGLGRPVNSRESVRWARRAAEQDCASKKRPVGLCAQARFLLGAAYFAGEGVPQDFFLAYVWANLGAADLSPGDELEGALAVRDGAARKLNKEQMAEAQRLCRDWKPVTSR